MLWKKPTIRPLRRIFQPIADGARRASEKQEQDAAKRLTAMAEAVTGQKAKHDG